MKILHIITKSELGGAQSVLANIVNSICEQHEVMVIAGEGDGKIFDNIDNRIVKIQYPHLRRAISVINDLRTLFFIRKKYDEFKPDVIHLHSSKVGLLGRLILPRNKIVYTVHGFDSIRVAYRRFLSIERWMQHRCAAIIGVSQYDVQNLLTEGIHHHVSLIYNGISKINLSLEEPLFLPEKYKKVVMCIARVAMPKRHDIFIACAKRLPDYAFVWIGNTEPIACMQENVFFLGNKPNAGSYCRYADLFMLPSDYEGLPIVILEAMSYGIPIVASDVGGISEIVIDGENGFTVQNDPDFFSEKIDYILRHDNVCQRFSDYSQKLYEAHFTDKMMVRSYLNIYQSIDQKKKL